MLLTATARTKAIRGSSHGVAVAIIIWESKGVLCHQFPVRNKKNRAAGRKTTAQRDPLLDPLLRRYPLPPPFPFPFQSLNWTQLRTGGRGRRGGREDSVLRRRLGRRLGVLFFGKIR